MFEPLQPKPISGKNLDAALDKAERYRAMNEPWEAESLCRDVLAREPDNQRALSLLVLSLTDHFMDELGGNVKEAQSLIRRLRNPYDRAFYTGVVCERKGKAVLAHSGREAGAAVYGWLQKAMQRYEEAEELGGREADDAILRWNTCARMINRNKHVRPPPGPPSGEFRAAKRGG